MMNNIQSKPNPLGKLSSRSISTKELVILFEKCKLPLELWDHYGRLRIVSYAITKYGFQKAFEQDSWLCMVWKKYKTSIGHGHLWHYTLTRFWGNIIYNLHKKGIYSSFDELYDKNPEIHFGKLFQKYYTNDVLFSKDARNHWVPPNLKNKIN